METQKFERGQKVITSNRHGEQVAYVLRTTKTTVLLVPHNPVKDLTIKQLDENERLVARYNLRNLSKQGTGLWDGHTIDKTEYDDVLAAERVIMGDRRRRTAVRAITAALESAHTLSDDQLFAMYRIVRGVPQ